MVQQRNIELPDKMSALLRLALSDLERVEKDSRYRVDMNTWHEPRKGLCSVCLAGSVMTRALTPEELFNYENDAFTEDTRSKLEALDYLRLGRVASAAMMMFGADVDHDSVLYSRLSRWVAFYDDNPEVFRSQLKKLAEDLELAGL